MVNFYIFKKVSYNKFKRVIISMSVLKKIGGILALIAGMLIAIYFIWYLLINGFPTDLNGILNVIINIALIVLTFLGAVLGIADKRSGGILLVVTAIIMILFTVLALQVSGLEMLRPYTIMYWLLGFDLYQYIFITLESILILVDGILVLAGGAD